MINYSVDQDDIFFDKLKKLDFACFVGAAIDNKNVIQIDNWECAIRNIRSQEWEDFWVDRHNDFHDQIKELKSNHDQVEEVDHEKIEEEIQAILKSLNEDEDEDEDEDEWNLMIRAIKSILLPIAGEKINSLTLDLDKKDAISSELNSVFVSAYLENKFSKNVTDPFYTRLLEWYFKGHFPCGWKGNYPDGKLIIF